MKLQRQVIAYALGGTLTALFLTGLGTAALLHHREVEAVDATLVATADAFARAPTGARWVGEDTKSPVQVRNAVPDNLEGERAVDQEELVFTVEGSERVLYYPTEAPDAHSSREHTHSLVIARMPAVQWQDTVGPFFLAYSAMVLLAAVLVAGVQTALLRAAFAPLDHAVSLLRGITATGSNVRMPEAGPDEVRNVLAEVNELLTRLDAAMSAQIRFTARAAHELRTPVAAVIGELELARRRPRTAEELTATVDRTLDASRRLGALVNALLALARVDAGHVEQGRTRVRASELLLRVIHETLPSGEVDVALDGDAEILVHEALLTAAIANLVRNAVAHAAPGPDRVAVEVVGDRVRFVVEDRGPGPVVVGADRFASSAGLGLGLPLAREVARRHGGDCRLEARPGGGCRAVIEVFAA